MNNKTLKHFEAAYPFIMTHSGQFLYSYTSLVQFLDHDGAAVLDFLETYNLTATANGNVY
jgi:hypothetical protein